MYKPKHRRSVASFTPNSESRLISINGPPVYWNRLTHIHKLAPIIKLPAHGQRSHNAYIFILWKSILRVISQNFDCMLFFNNNNSIASAVMP